MKKNKSFHFLFFLMQTACFNLFAQEHAPVSNHDFLKTNTVIYSFDFNSCTTGSIPGSSFTTFNISGDSVWRCSNAGFNNTNSVQINGFSTAINGPVLNEDWLISPLLNISSTSFPLLSFRSRSRFSGPLLKLFVSTNYSGSGNPSTATWVEIAGKFPNANSDTWTLSDSINLSSFKSSATYVAWVYYSSPSNGASRWTIDDVIINNSLVPPAPVINLPSTQPKLFNFGILNNGQISVSKTAQFAVENLTGNLTVTAPSGFEISKTNTVFSSAIQFTNAELNGIKTIYIRFKPTASDAGFGGSLLFTGTNFSTGKIDLSGSSLPKNKSLDVVNWNLEWFGSLSNGPVDENLQMRNAVKVMDSLDADIYLLQEIVDTSLLGTLSRSLKNGPYDYVVSLYASLASSNTSANWPSAQKLAYVYRRSVFSAITSRGFTRTSFNPDNNYNWASGRFPFLLEANVSVDGITKRISFLNIHAKSESGLASDYQRRLEAATLMYDSLNVFFSTNHFLVAGDYNDDLDETISTTAGTTVTPYETLVLSPWGYAPVSLWNSIRGESSYIGRSNVIDHAVASNEMNLDYHPFSCFLRTDAVTWVNDYLDSLTDHIPLQTRFNLRQSNTNIITGVTNLISDPGYIKISGLPSSKPIIQFMRPVTSDVNLMLMNSNGQTVWFRKLERVANGQSEALNLSHLPKGMYLLVVQSKQGRFTSKIIN